jgi:hypothetical protein
MGKLLLPGLLHLSKQLINIPGTFESRNLFLLKPLMAIKDHWKLVCQVQINYKFHCSADPW